MTTPQELLAQKAALIRQKREAMTAGLPHLYEKKWYQWAWDFFSSKNKMCLLCAANQISKSSTQIRKCIEWAGNPALWPELWKNRPRVFWYLYPDAGTATREFDLKWKEFLPRGEFASHPTYGYRVVRAEKNKIDYIEFASGIRVQFVFYSQRARNLQSTTVDAIFCDEELPEELYPEFSARMIATDGYFHMVFTATLNQDFWKLAIEGDGETEKFPDAHKQQVSMRQCITYRDGTPGHFTEERIKAIEAKCANETERQRRVDGRFITEIGRKYAQYDATRHIKPAFPVPKDWHRYGAADIGGGGEGHPPAICFIAVRPDFRFGVVYKGWRGDDGQLYTSGDVFNKFLEMRGSENLVLQKFDQAAKDFGTIADRVGESFLPSDKSHDRGEEVINTLFKHDMLIIFDTSELQKLGGELGRLLKDTPKRKAKDDFADAFRYGVVDIPWDWTWLQNEPTEEAKAEVARRPFTPSELVALEIEERRGEFGKAGQAKDDWSELDQEFADWNEAYGT